MKTSAANPASPVIPAIFCACPYGSFPRRRECGKSPSRSNSGSLQLQEQNVAVTMGLCNYIDKMLQLQWLSAIAGANVAVTVAPCSVFFCIFLILAGSYFFGDKNMACGGFGFFPLQRTGEDITYRKKYTLKL
jgi:hypothetical protein